jgi:hypothetical protein
MAIAAKKVTRKNTKKSAPRAAARVATPKRKTAVPEFTAKEAIEITAAFPDTLGLTAKVAKALAAENVNILAGTGYSASGMRRKAIFTLIVDNYAKAERALEKIGADDLHESSVIMVETPNKVGALERVSKIIADAGINIYYFYATTSSGKTATSVFKTADDKKTIRVLSKV